MKIDVTSHNFSRKIVQLGVLTSILLFLCFFISIEISWRQIAKAMSYQLRDEMVSSLNNELAEGNLFRVSSAISRLKQGAQILNGSLIQIMDDGTSNVVYSTKNSVLAAIEFNCGGKDNIRFSILNDKIRFIGEMTNNIKGVKCNLLDIEMIMPKHLKKLKVNLYLILALLTIVIELIFIFVVRTFHTKVLALEREKEKEFNEQNNRIGKIARQVAHDIRSPLAVLNLMLKGSVEGLSEEVRVAMRGQINRIQDIANDLLAKNKQISSHVGLLLKKDDESVELLSSCIEEIITEKRINLRPHLGIILLAEIYDERSYGLFAKINLAELKRILSNLINNAEEAFPEKKGTITVQLKGINNDTISIVVSDNGQGIPKEVISILGREGISYGKEKNNKAGSGLGLYHAKTIIEKWGGQLKIESEMGKGTIISIILPKSDPPDWFVPQIKLTANCILVILDDDLGIHQTWNGRFKLMGIEKHSVDIIHISNANDFRKYFQKINSNLRKDIYCLSDYELIGDSESGLDLIEDLKLMPHKSFLVTSHYENEKIRLRCQKSGIKLIPKMLAGFVPITIEYDSKIDPSEKMNLIVLLTDDASTSIDVENIIKNTIKRSSVEFAYKQVVGLNQFQQFLSTNNENCVFCFIDYKIFSNHKEKIKDDLTIKYSILLERDVSPFDLDNKNELSSIIYRQRARMIPRVINEFFNQRMEVC